MLKCGQGQKALLETMLYSNEIDHPTCCWVKTLAQNNILGGFDIQFPL